MKKNFSVLFGILLCSVPCFVGAQSSPAPAKGAAMVVGYQIGGQGANHRVWQKIIRTVDAQGNPVLTTNQAFVELATGLNCLDPATGQWRAAKEEIDAYPGGAIGQYGQHQVIFANNLNTAGALDLQMANGQALQSEILGLSYLDTASGKSVLIAEVKDSQGQIVHSNQVLYPDAFKGVSANVRYRYTKAGLEQDVILLQQPPLPEAFGLSSASSVLQVLTEFTSAPTPTIRTRAGSTSGGGLADELLDFGAMKMIQGRAFLLGTNSTSAAVGKQWVTVNGRAILVESVRLPAIRKQLAQLPAFSLNTLKPAGGSALYTVATKRWLPAPKIAKVETGEMKLAKQTPPNHGLVLDYIVVNGYQNTPTVFQGGTTYFISGPLYCYNVTLEGGAVIKYPNDTPAFIEIVSDPVFTCQTGPYRPAVFTAADDYSVGEDVGGAWAGHGGVIQPGGYANPALRFDDHVGLHDVRICYAQEAISAWSGANVSVTDSQIINGINGVSLWTGAGGGDYTGNGGPGIIVNNCLIASPDPNHSGGDALSGGGSPTLFQLKNCTIDNFSTLMGSGDDNSSAGNIDGETSVFTDLGDFGGGSLEGNDDVFWNTPGTFGDGSEYDDYGYPYIQVGGGAYYLNPNVPSSSFG